MGLVVVGAGIATCNGIAIGAGCILCGAACTAQWRNIVIGVGTVSLRITLGAFATLLFALCSLLLLVSFLLLFMGFLFLLLGQLFFFASFFLGLF